LEQLTCACTRAILIPFVFTVTLRANHCPVHVGEITADLGQFTRVVSEAQ